MTHWVTEQTVRAVKTAKAEGVEQVALFDRTPQPAMAAVGTGRDRMS
jgi:hypothetical protein